MRHETVTHDPSSQVDWKGLGYVVSIVSVLLLGAIAWPSETEPRWHVPVLVLGVLTSITGMAMRYRAHILQQRELKQAEAEARRN
jgi:hypothetical protein